MPTPEDQDEAAFARTANSDVFGKLDAELQAIRMDSETLLKLHREANDVGMSVTEFCRTVLRGRAWGAEHVENVNAERVRRAMGNAGTLRGNEVAA